MDNLENGKKKVTVQQESHQASDQSAVIGVALAGAISVAVAEGPFTLWSTIIGIMLLIILIAYSTEKSTNWFKCLAFGAVAAFCTILILGVNIENYTNSKGIELGEYVFKMWCILSVASTFIVWCIRKNINKLIFNKIKTLGSNILMLKNKDLNR